MKNQLPFRKASAQLIGALLCVFLLSAEQTKANNVQISGVSISGTDISFNISWENSWYVSSLPGNWDAVWVFVKYKDCATTNWLHAPTIATPTASPTFGVLQVDYAADQMGVFVRRIAVGTGNISATPVTISLSIPGGVYDFKVFGIEMVQVLPENFQVGDAASTSTFSNVTITAASQAAGIGAGALYAGSPAVANTFPMGQGAAPVGSVNGIGVLSYAMKYEISQEEYVE